MRQFVPPLRWLLARYGQGEDTLRARLKELKAPDGMAGFKPTGQRELLGELRPEPPVPASAEPPFDPRRSRKRTPKRPRSNARTCWFDTMG